jgi:recombination protein RecA
MAKTSALMEALNNITKQYGDDVVETGVEKNDYDRIPFSSPRLNYMSFGGLPLGHLHEFSGPEGSGKTTTAFDIIKNAQKKFAEEYKIAKKENPDAVERKVVFCDVEGTFDYAWANKFGVDTTKIIRLKMAGWPASEVLNALLELMKQQEVGLGVLDSIAAMPADQLADKSVGDKIYGGIALPLQNFTNQVKRYLVENNSMIIAINQVRDNLSSMFGGTTTPGGRGFRHACSTRLEFRKGKFIDENNKELTSNAENPAGNLINVVVLKSKVFPSTRRVGYYTIKYVTGPDLMNDYIEVGLQVGVINQRGAFYDIMDPTTGEILSNEKIQGKVNLRAVLENHPEWLQLIDNVIDGKEVSEIVDEDTLAKANEQVANSKED